MEHILIVEDDRNIRETLRDILELSGYQISTASDGKEGYDTIIAECPDLVLCDVNMPKMDGFELLGAINQRLKDEIIPPFLFLSAKVEKEDIRHGMSLGADDYILKPFDNSEILNIIRLRLDKRAKLLDIATPNATEDIASSFDKLALPCEDGLELVPFDDIVKCLADRSYCTFHLTDGRSVLVSKPLKYFERVLENKHFMKVHKSTIVNLKFVQKYIQGKGGYLLLSDGSHVVVSTRKKEQLMKLLKHIV